MAARVTALSIVQVATLCIACTGCDWPWRHDMADQPSPSAAQGPRLPDRSTFPIAARGPRDRDLGEAVVSPLSADRANVENGRRLYAIYCLPCHGTSGSGRDGPVAKYFPRIGDLASADIQRHGDGWLFATITTGHQAMPAYSHELDVNERWQIVGFVRTLGR